MATEAGSAALHHVDAITPTAQLAARRFRRRHIGVVADITSRKICAVVPGEHAHAMSPDGDAKPPLACTGAGSAMVAATVAVAISANCVILIVVTDAFLAFACPVAVVMQ